ncbi:MAG: DNA polymerase I [Thermomicrobiales bacterium]
MKTENGKSGARPTLILIDGYGLIFRAYHALPPTLTTAAGEQVNAVFGFASMLLDTFRSQKPDYAVVALEGGRTFRQDEFEDYKAHRGEMPDDLRNQIGRVRQLIDVLGIPIEQVDGWEADDVIGSLSKKCPEAAGVDVVIVTGDSDLLQLVGDNVVAVLPGARRFGELRLFDRDAVVERYGFGPELIPDYKALVGDTSDNIPGVPGIGEKTATALITQFGPLEQIIDHLDEVTPIRAKTALAANVEQAKLSKRLATIERTLEVPFDLEQSAISDYDREAAIELFRELEFRTLVPKLPEPGRPAAPTAVRKVSTRNVIRSADALKALVTRIRETGRYAFDVEATSTDPNRAVLVGISIATTPDEGYYIPVGHKEGEQLRLEDVQKTLAQVLVDKKIQGYAHHGKYDLLVLSRHGFELTNLVFDTMVAAYLLGENAIGLKDLAFTKLGIQMTEISELIGIGRNQLTMDCVDIDLAGDYACGDVESTLALAELFGPELTERGMDDLFYNEEMPLIPVLVDIERTGIAIDIDYLKQFSEEITNRFGQVEQEIHQVVGRAINVGSTKQIATLLFDELKLQSGRRTKTGYSVDSDVLEALVNAHPVVPLILEYRTLSKLKSTYVDALPLQVNPETGRVHTSYNQTIAATGRLSSQNPNLQNIPIRTELGRRVRRAFVADHRPDKGLFPDPILVSADYSQIELRLMAHMSGEPFLVDAFRQGEDIHAATAGLVYGVEPEEVTPDLRRIAKTVNFGLLYGMQAYGLSRDTGLSRADAQKFIDQYWSRLPKVREYFDRTLRFGASHGYVQAPSGRRRILPDLISPNGQRRAPAERMAINMPLQGAAADIMKMAMIQLADNLVKNKLRAKMLLQVHDELVLEVPKDELKKTAKVVVETMENATKLDVPLVAEISAGDNWEELNKVEISRG